MRRSCKLTTIILEPSVQPVVGASFTIIGIPACTPTFGYGIDDPLDNTLLPGLAAARITRNDFFFGNLIWDVTPNLELGFEVSHWETSYLNITPIDVDNSAMIYHTRVRLKF